MKYKLILRQLHPVENIDTTIDYVHAILNEVLLYGE